MPALNLNQIHFMGGFSISNEKKIRNIIWNAQGYKTGMFIEIIETNYQGWTWTVATRVTYISCMLAFMSNFKKGGASHIVDMEIILSLRKLSITTNARMIQPSRFQVGGPIRVEVRKYQMTRIGRSTR